MTLSEIAAYVCSKIGQTDAASVAACKGFIAVRYRMIWDAALWRDSLALVSVTTTAGSNWLVLPRNLDTVLKVRVNTTTIGPFDAGTVFDYNPDLFDNQGTPAGFITCAPVVCGPNPTSGHLLVSLGGSGVGLDGTLTGIVEAEYKSSTNSAGTENARLTFALGQLTVDLGTDLEFVLGFTKPVSDGNYAIGFAAALDYTLNPSDTSAARRPRIKLLQGPSTATSVLCLCKRRCPIISEDADEPLLTNIDNALVAFAQSDMLERQRQYAKAAAKAQEAAGQLKIMLNLELEQSASEQRLIPADIHGSTSYNDTFGSQGKLYW